MSATMSRKRTKMPTRTDWKRQAMAMADCLGELAGIAGVSKDYRSGGTVEDEVMGLAKAVLDIAEHVDEQRDCYDGDGLHTTVRADLDGIAVALRAAVTAADEPIPVGVPVESKEDRVGMVFDFFKEVGFATSDGCNLMALARELVERLK